jgi:hypothetical protein
LERITSPWFPPSHPARTEGLGVPCFLRHTFGGCLGLSEAWKCAGESGSFIPQLEGKNRVSKRTQLGHGLGADHNRPTHQVAVLKSGNSD